MENKELIFAIPLFINKIKVRGWNLKVIVKIHDLENKCRCGIISNSEIRAQNWKTISGCNLNLQR